MGEALKFAFSFHSSSPGPWLQKGGLVDDMSVAEAVYCLEIMVENEDYSGMCILLLHLKVLNQLIGLEIWAKVKACFMSNKEQILKLVTNVFQRPEPDILEWNPAEAEQEPISTLAKEACQIATQAMDVLYSNTQKRSRLRFAHIDASWVARTKEGLDQRRALAKKYFFDPDPAWEVPASFMLFVFADDLLDSHSTHISLAEMLVHYSELGLVDVQLADGDRIDIRYRPAKQSFSFPSDGGAVLDLTKIIAIEFLLRVGRRISGDLIFEVAEHCFVSDFLRDFVQEMAVSALRRWSDVIPEHVRAQLLPVLYRSYWPRIIFTGTYPEKFLELPMGFTIFQRFAGLPDLTDEDAFAIGDLLPLAYNGNRYYEFSDAFLTYYSRFFKADCGGYMTSVSRLLELIMDRVSSVYTSSTKQFALVTILDKLASWLMFAVRFPSAKLHLHCTTLIDWFLFAYCTRCDAKHHAPICANVSPAYLIAVTWFRSAASTASIPRFLNDGAESLLWDLFRPGATVADLLPLLHQKALATMESIDLWPVVATAPIHSAYVLWNFNGPDLMNKIHALVKRHGWEFAVELFEHQATVELTQQDICKVWFNMCLQDGFEWTQHLYPTFMHALKSSRVFRLNWRSLADAHLNSPPAQWSMNGRHFMTTLALFYFDMRWTSRGFSMVFAVNRPPCSREEYRKRVQVLTLMLSARVISRTRANKPATGIALLHSDLIRLIKLTLNGYR